MGYAILMAACGQCGKFFSFNPRKVPSLRNVPFCQQCVDAANPEREKNGLPPIVYAADAYEPIMEECL